MNERSVNDHLKETSMISVVSASISSEYGTVVKLWQYFIFHGVIAPLQVIL
jgi:hypothetical protein